MIEAFRPNMDSDESDEEDVHCGKCCNRGIIKNSSKSHFYWDVFIILLVIYNTFSVPFDAAFSNVSILALC